MTKQSIGRWFWDELRQDPDRVVLLEGRDEFREPIPAGKVMAEATRVAIALSRRGLTAGQRVLVASESRLEAWMCQLATWMLGAVTVHIPLALSEELTELALSRARASWMVVESPRVLGGLELVATDQVSSSEIILFDSVPKDVDRVSAYTSLLDEGFKNRTLGLDPLARQMFAVPPDARAAILYWEGDDGELAAAALTHAEIMTSFAEFPLRWNVSGGPVFSTIETGTRQGLLVPWRTMATNKPLGVQGSARSLVRAIGQVQPRLLVTESATVEALLDSLDKEESQMSVRGVLRRSLGWMDRGESDWAQAKTARDAALDAVVSGLGNWVERGLAKAVKRRLGGVLKTVWCTDGLPGEDAQALLAAADVRLTDTEA